MSSLPPDPGCRPAGTRLLIVSHYYAPHPGGVEVVAGAQATSAAQRGMDVTVLTSAVGAGDDDRAASEEPAVRVVRAPAWNGLEQRFGVPFPVFGPRFIRAAWREVGRADVVHVHDVLYLSSLAAGVLALLRRRALYVTLHVGVVDHPRALVVLAQQLVYRTVGRLLLRRARRTVVYNPNVKRAALRFGADAARLVETANGVDVQAFRPCPPAAKADLRRRLGLPVDQPLVLFVGRLVPKKGAEIVLRARSAGWLTVLVGPGESGGWPSDPHTRVIGPVPRHRLADWYRAADVFVLPSSGEVFTLCMQEAMASGLPVVTTDDAGYQAYGVDRSMVRLVPRDPDAVRAAVDSLVGDPAGRARAASYSRRYAVEHFSWEANVDRLLDLYPALAQ